MFRNIRNVFTGTVEQLKKKFLKDCGDMARTKGGETLACSQKKKRFINSQITLETLKLTLLTEASTRTNSWVTK